MHATTSRINTNLQSDKLGRRWGMGIGCFLTIIATFMQTFSPNLGCFIAGRVVIGLGQGIALSTCAVQGGRRDRANRDSSIRTHLHW